MKILFFYSCILSLLLLPLCLAAQTPTVPFSPIAAHKSIIREAAKQTPPKLSFYVSGFGSFAEVADTEMLESLNLPIPENTIPLDPAFGGGGAIGLRYSILRAEFEVSYQNFGFDEQTSTLNLSGDLGQLNFMSNLYLDIPLTDRLDWYIGGGVGISRYKLNQSGTSYGFDATVNDKDNVFAYQFQTGLAYKLTQHLEMYGGYRFLSSNNPVFNNFEYTAPTSHAAILGLRYNF
ncbi:outer membrane protein [Poriferisphaera sp. WC338]|uniref:outer membrane protein n=1 Tax=Poriferisphaera sp. WC338 TaxID=3425129 RepID=UPI003D8187A6